MESDLPRRPKGDLGENGVQLREQTVMTMEWIANRLQMGTRTHLNHQSSALLASPRQNAKGKVILYNTIDRPPVLLEIELAFEASRALIARGSEGVRAIQEYATAILVDLIGGFAF